MKTNCLSNSLSMAFDYCLVQMFAQLLKNWAYTAVSPLLPAVITAPCNISTVTAAQTTTKRSQITLAKAIINFYNNIFKLCALVEVYRNTAELTQPHYLPVEPILDNSWSMTDHFSVVNNSFIHRDWELLPSSRCHLWGILDAIHLAFFWLFRL